MDFEKIILWLGINVLGIVIFDWFMQFIGESESDEVYNDQSDTVLINRPKLLWQKEAEDHGADLARVQVWTAFSELFLANYQSEPEVEWLGEIIADSPFSFEELAHILLFELAPVCAPNLLLPAGEWALFDPDWLLERCMQQQRKHPFRSNGNPKKAPFFVHVFGFGPTIDAYRLLYRAQRIRDSRSAP